MQKQNAEHRGPLPVIPTVRAVLVILIRSSSSTTTFGPKKKQMPCAAERYQRTLMHLLVT